MLVEKQMVVQHQQIRVEQSPQPYKQIKMVVFQSLSIQTGTNGTVGHGLSKEDWFSL